MVDNFQVPSMGSIAILAQPTPHLTVLGVTPMIIDEIGAKKLIYTARKNANNHCDICGRNTDSNKDSSDWLRAQDVYDIDKKHKIYHFEKYVAICQYCYYYINQGVLATRLQQGQVDQIFYDYILDRGNRLLSVIDATKDKNNDTSESYIMEYKGNYFINDIFPDKAAKKYLEGTKIIQFNKSIQKLPDYLYYAPSK